MRLSATQPTASDPSSVVRPGAATRPRIALVVACLALFSDMFVYGLAIPVLPLLPATTSAGPGATGTLFAGYAVAMIVATPVAGRLVDRWGPRPPLLVGLFGLAAASLMFALVGSFAPLVVARVLQGLAAGMSWVAGLSLIAAVTPPAQRGRWMGLAMSMVSVGVLLGPPVSGLLVEAAGPRIPFLVATVLALLAGTVPLVLLRGLTASDEDFAGPLAVLRVPGTVSILVAVVLGAGSLAAVQPVLPVRLVDGFGLGPAGIGGLFALLVVCGAALNPVVGGLVGRVDARVLIGSGVVLVAVALIVVATAGQVWAVAVGMGVLGASNAFLLAPATTLIGGQGMAAAPPALGASYASFNLAYAAGLVVGPLLGGWVTGWLGFTLAVVVLAALALTLGGAGLVRLPHGTTRLAD